MWLKFKRWLARIINRAHPGKDRPGPLKRLSLWT